LRPSFVHAVPRQPIALKANDFINVIWGFAGFRVHDDDDKGRKLNIIHEARVSRMTKRWGRSRAHMPSTWSLIHRVLTISQRYWAAHMLPCVYVHTYTHTRRKCKYTWRVMT
jgi:hypothetical protein